MMYTDCSPNNGHSCPTPAERSSATRAQSTPTSFSRLQAIRGRRRAEARSRLRRTRGRRSDRSRSMEASQNGGMACADTSSAPDRARRGDHRQDQDHKPRHLGHTPREARLPRVRPRAAGLAAAWQSARQPRSGRGPARAPGRAPFVMSRREDSLSRVTAPGRSNGQSAEAPLGVVRLPQSAGAALSRRLVWTAGSRPARARHRARSGPLHPRRAL
jgi:hypothetical protein